MTKQYLEDLLKLLKDKSEEMGGLLDTREASLIKNGPGWSREALVEESTKSLAWVHAHRSLLACINSLSTTLSDLKDNPLEKLKQIEFLSLRPRWCMECGNSFDSDASYRNLCPNCLSKLPEKVLCTTCEEKGIDPKYVPRQEIGTLNKFDDGTIEYECIECLTDWCDAEKAAKYQE